jgi:hypothetical protein
MTETFADEASAITIPSLFKSDLVIKFGDILETPTIFPDEQGKVKVVVTNQGIGRFRGPLDLNLYASTDPVLDDNPLNTLDLPLRGKDELLGTLNLNNVNLKPGQSKTFTLDFSKPEFRTASVVSPGSYYLIAEVDPGNSIRESNENNNQASTHISTDGTDVVLDWNSTLLNAIQAVATRPITAPPFGARNSAIVHAAIYDAVNAIDRSYTPYLVNIDASRTGASPEAAVVGAAYQTLINLYPTEAAAFEAQRLRSLAEIPDGAAEDAGFALGVSVANQILALRSNDGAAGADNVPYTVPPAPGVWRPTPIDDGLGGFRTEEPLLVGWGEVTPFAIPSVEDVLQGTGVDGPPALDSIQYAEEIEEVRLFGGLENTEVTTIARTAEQTEIAKFWAYDRPDTFRPPGQYNELAQEVALQQGNTLVQNARLFALLNIAMADAGIVTWDVKYDTQVGDTLGFNQWRPVTAIREADTDGNPDTIQDPNWRPLLDTPPFPDYISGHATFGAAAGQILASFFGTDNISFDIPSQELPGVAREFGSFSEFVEENALSRVYGGIHFRSSAEDGVIAGTAVGDYVFGHVATLV